MKQLHPSRFLPTFLLFSALTAFLAGSAQGQEGASSTNADVEPQSLSRSIYLLANQIFEGAQVVRYQHVHRPAEEQITAKQNDSCEAVNDCSGFVSYVLEKLAPKHYEQVLECEPRYPYPKAKTYATFFQGLTPGEAKDGWLRLSDYKQLRQGDIIAWRKRVDPDEKTKNTGHVMIVAHRPGEVVVDQNLRYLSVPVIDSSSMDHFPPEKLPPNAHQEHRDGVGKGMIRLILDPNNQVIGYWEGTYWGEGQKEIKHPSYTDAVAFARLVSMPKN